MIFLFFKLSRSDPQLFVFPFLVLEFLLKVCVRLSQIVISIQYFIHFCVLFRISFAHSFQIVLIFLQTRHFFVEPSLMLLDYRCLLFQLLVFQCFISNRFFLLLLAGLGTGLFTLIFLQSFAIIYQLGLYLHITLSQLLLITFELLFLSVF
jgi:hypothetical protein